MIGALLGSYMFAARASREDVRAVEKRMESIRTARIRSAKTSEQHARAVEDDLGRVALLARALAEVCLKKGLLTHAELGKTLLEIDMKDGTGDGKLDPDVVMPGESKLAKLKHEDKPRRVVRKKPRPR